MADFNLAALNYAVQELWDQDAEDARYEAGVILNRVTNKSEIAKKKGDIIHVLIEQRYTPVAVGSDGVFVPVNYTLQGADITLNQWYALPIQILDQAASQSIWTPESSFGRDSGAAFAEKYDTDLGALHTSVAAANVVGSTTTPKSFDLGLLKQAMLVLAKGKVPLKDLSLILHHNAYYGGILNEKELTRANESGQPKSLMTTGFKPPLLGVPVYLTNQIATTGSPPVNKNLLLHKSALAIAWSKSNAYEKVRATANLTLADLLVVQNVWGSAVIRSDHFVVINSSDEPSFYGG